jgi:hypothetical protein
MGTVREIKEVTEMKDGIILCLFIGGFDYFFDVLLLHFQIIIVLYRTSFFLFAKVNVSKM